MDFFNSQFSDGLVPLLFFAPSLHLLVPLASLFLMALQVTVLVDDIELGHQLRLIEVVVELTIKKFNASPFTCLGSRLWGHAFTDSGPKIHILNLSDCLK